MLAKHKFDIITLSETWLKDNPLLLNHVTIPGYKNECNRDGKRGGGMLACILERVCNIKEEDDIMRKDSIMEQLWFQVKYEKDSFLLAVLYQQVLSWQIKEYGYRNLESLIAYVNTTWTGPITNWCYEH